MSNDRTGAAEIVNTSRFHLATAKQHAAVASSCLDRLNADRTLSAAQRALVGEALEALLDCSAAVDYLGDVLSARQEVERFWSAVTRQDV